MNEIEIIDKCIKELEEDNLECDNSIDKMYNNLMKAHYAFKFFNAKEKASEIKIEYDFVNYNKNEYVVCKVGNKNTDKLFIIDKNDFDKIKYVHWHCTCAGYIITYFKIKRKSVMIFLHNFIMNKLTFNGKGQTLTVDHINRIVSDNRKENLRIISQSEQNFNRIRSERRCILPDNCNINIEDLPRCVAYRNSRGSHGEYFEILITNFNGKKLQWSTASSLTLSLKFKFEHAKKYLRYLKTRNPNEFKKHHIEKQYNDKEINLIDSYNKIIELSKYSKPHMKVIYDNKNYLTEDLNNLSASEIELLKNCNFDKIPNRRKGKVLKIQQTIQNK